MEYNHSSKVNGRSSSYVLRGQWPLLPRNHAYGSIRDVVEKNVVKQNQKIKPIPPNADSKTLEKLTRENKKIEQANQSRLNSVKEFEKFFNCSSINGTKNSLGEPVFFKFIIIEEKVENTACIQTSRA